MKMVEKKVKGNWEVKIVTKKTILGVLSYTLYVFDRTLRQFALIKNFDSYKEAKDYFNNMTK